MFNYIKGSFISSGDGYVVIESGSIGYTVFTSLNTVGRLTANAEVKLYTYLYLREGIMDLYGFATEEERSMFLNLISISGVGPKAAISVLSVAPPEKIALAILTGDSKLIQKAQGVGAKVSQRIVMELKDKIDKNIDTSSLGEEEEFTLAESASSSEALSALMVLGYSQAEAKKALSSAGESDSTEEMIKKALKELI